MSKPRSSPRRGGRRSKATPPDTPNVSYDDGTQPPLAKFPAKSIKSSPVNKTGRGVTSSLKKPMKPPRGRGAGKKMGDSKAKEVKGRRQSGGKKAVKKVEPEEVSSNEEEEEEEEEEDTVEEREEEQPTKRKDKKGYSKNVNNETSVQTPEKDNVEHETKRNNDTNESVGHSVGEELMERLSKGGKKKKAMRNCSNCGVQSPVSRAKKCPNCGKNLFSKSCGYSREVTCPRCDYQQRYNGSKTTVYCGRCNNLLTRKYRDESPVQTLNGSLEENDKTDMTPSNKLEAKDEPSDSSSTYTSVVQGEGEAEVEGSAQNDGSFSFPISSDGTYQVGYSCKLLRTGVELRACEDVEAGHEDSLSLFGNETSQETLRRIIKRKILGEVDQSTSDNGPPTKKTCKDDDPNVSSEEKMVQPPQDNTSQSQQPSSLAISSSSNTTSLTTQSGAVSSPLMEYAQKISARIFIPPEIPPQEAYRKGRPRGPSSRSSKSHSAKNKRQGKDGGGGDVPRPSSPTTTSPPPPDPPALSSSQDSSSSFNEHLPLPPPPPLVSSEKDIAFTRSLSSSSRHSAPPDTLPTPNEFTDAHLLPESSHAVSPLPTFLPPLVSTTKPFHDPTINSIRMYSHSLSNTNKFYSGQSLAPPLIVSSTYSPPWLIKGESAHSNQVVSKDLYPGCRTSSVPPLLPMSRDEKREEGGYMEEGLLSVQPSFSVAHRTVIVDPRNIHIKSDNKDSSAPPVLVSSSSTNPASPSRAGQLSVQQMSENQDGVNATPSGDIGGKTPTLVSDEMVFNNEISVSKDAATNQSDDHKSKHSKRKQKLHLTDTSELESRDGIIYETSVSKKKKKKKKKEKDRERDRSEKGHHSKSKSEKHKMDPDRKARKKLKKEKRKEKEMGEGCATTEEEETMGESQEELDEETSQCTMEDDKGRQECMEEGEESVLYSVKIKDCMIHQINWGEHQMVLLVPQSQDSKEKETTPSSSAERPSTPTICSVTTADAETGSTSSTSRGRRLRSSLKKRKDEELEGPEEEQTAEDVSPSLTKEKRKKKKRQSNIKGKMKIERAELQYDPEQDPPPPPPPPPEEDSQSSQNGGEDTTEVEGVIDPSSLPPSFSIYELRNKIFSGFPPRTVHAFTYKMKIRTHRPPLYWIHILKRIGGLPETCHMCRMLDVESLRLLCSFHKLDVPECLDNLITSKPNMTGRKLIDLSEQDPASFVLNPEVLHLSLPHSTFHGSRQKTHGTSTTQSHPEGEVPTKREYRKRKLPQIEPDQAEEGEEEESPEQQQPEEEEQRPVEAKKRKYSKRAVAPLKNLPMPSNTVSPNDEQVSPPRHTGTGRKKPCPNCGYSMLRKSKKCGNCGKPFGVFTFGRRQCTYCWHINLARMSTCFKCGQSLDKAPTAVPKITELFEPQEVEAEPVAIVKHDFKFGVKRKRRVHSSLPSNPSPTAASFSAVMIGSSKQHHPNGSPAIESPDEVFNDESGTSSPIPFLDKKKGETHHLGYRYGKIPWNDADLALVITSGGTPKLCLQEVCSKVLRYHQKAEVFELVRNLNLQLEPGDSNLLKKLQALGLHPNRSPMCRLLASEDLFALMDALEEPVPDEVYQYLGTVGSSNSPTESDGVLLNHCCSPLSPNNTSGSTRTLPLVIGDDQEHGFESTLHEIQCSDGQLLAMLRSWDGDHFLCLLEVWRRYFPEVNRSHLSSVIKRLDIETKIPTSQQTNLLRAAGVISVRGAPGRLIRVSDVQKLMDDFGVLLKIGGECAIDDEGTQFLPSNGQPGMLTDLHLADPSKITAVGAKQRGEGGGSGEVNELATCMSLLMDCIEPSVIETMIVARQKGYVKQIREIESEIQGQSKQENIQHNHILCRRELCTILTDEISFLTVSNHSTMSELVRLSSTLQKLLHDIDALIDFSKFMNT